MTRKLPTLCAFISAIFAFESGALAQQSESTTQQFNVIVPSTLSITAPPAVSIVHNQNDANQTFPDQPWQVQSNNSQGSVLTMETGSAFTNVVGTSTYKRDALLSLGLISADAGSNWTVTAASDQTDYVATDEVATVTAASDAPGDATFRLTVTFVDSDFSTLAAGTYSTVVTGTITAN